MASVNAQRDADTMAKIDNAIFGARPKAAEELGKTGFEEGNLALGATGQAGNAAANLTGISAESRKTSFAINKSVQQDITNAIEGVMAAFA
jgi:hypothetical protein